MGLIHPGLFMETTPVCGPEKQPRLVLFGAQGFISKLLQSSARPHWETLALGRPDFDLENPKCIPHLQTVLRETDHVVFLSARTPEHGRSEEAQQRNIRMFENAAQALMHRGFAHLSYLSSDAVYAWIEEPVTERSPIAPSDPYGKMHAHREELAAALAQQCRRPLAILRPAAVHGPADTHNAYGPNRLIREARDSQTLTLFGEGEEIRAHLWEENCVNWLLEASKTRLEGTLNVTPREAVSFLQLAEHLRAVISPTLRIIHAERRQPITHRRFDPTLREHLWPHLPPLPLRESLHLHWNRMRFAPARSPSFGTQPLTAAETTDS